MPRRGQAALETSLTLPLVVFMVLGGLQLMLLGHARIMAKVAAYRATRAGSLGHGNCERMTQAALLTVMPAIESFASAPLHGRATDVGEGLAQAFGKRRFNRYDDLISDGGADARARGTIVWIKRTLGGRTTDAGRDDSDFDQDFEPMRLETRLVFWFPLRIPFANWVYSRLTLAQWGVRAFDRVNPLMPAESRANWDSHGTTLERQVLSEMSSRSARGELVFPITATWTMRMLSPLKRAYLATACPGTPVTL